MSDVDEEQAASSPPPARPSPTGVEEISFESVLKMGLQDSSSDESDDESAGGHARPFFGLLPTRCTIPDCHVTPIAGGRFYHRCAAKAVQTAMKRRRLLSPPPAPSPPPSEPSHSQAQLPCAGVVIWSLPNSIALRINDEAYGPAPFDPAAAWQRQPVCACARCDDDVKHDAQRQLRQEITQRTRAERKTQQQILALYE